MMSIISKLKYINKQNKKYLDDNAMKEICKDFYNNPVLLPIAEVYGEWRDKSAQLTNPNLRPIYSQKDSTVRELVFCQLFEEKINDIFRAADDGTTIRNAWQQAHGFAVGTARLIDKQHAHKEEWRLTHQVACHILMRVYGATTIDEAKEMISSVHKAIASNPLAN